MYLSMLNAFHAVSHLISITTLQIKYHYHIHFTNEETDATPAYVVPLNSQNLLCVRAETKLRQTFHLYTSNSSTILSLAFG